MQGEATQGSAFNESFHNGFDSGISVRELLKPLQKYLQEDGITEICVNEPGVVFYEQRGKWHQDTVKELTYANLFSLGVAVAKYSDNEFGDVAPILSATLPDGERAQFVMPPACKAETISLTIRRPSFCVRTIDNYVADGFFNHLRPKDKRDPAIEELSALKQRLNDASLSKEEQADLRARFLVRAVELNQNIVICGQTGSGKTTFMKALMQSIDPSQRIITIEDVPELLYGLPNHKNQVNLFYPSEAKEDSLVTAASLLRSCLRMKPDRILLAELRGGETYDYLNVCLSGHGGSITSCHSGSCKEAFDYLALKVLQSPTGKELPYKVIERLLHQVINVVVHIHNSKDIGRHITEIWYEPGYEVAA